MASAFSPDDPAVFFRPERRPRYEEGRRRLLLWPAYAYRVVAPAVKPRALDVLQKATLGLARVGIILRKDIAAKLALHENLVTHLVTELQGEGLLGHDGLPTTRGLEALDDDSFDDGPPVVGYVFVDPETGSLWPRFVTQLPFAQTERLEGQEFPRLVLGSTGTPFPVHGWWHRPGALPPVAPPEPAAILDASRRHRRAIRFRGRETGEDTVSLPRGPGIDRISRVEDEPMRVFLATDIYVPEGAGDTAEAWTVRDPFGLGESPRLRRWILARRNADLGLARCINSVLERVASEGHEERALWRTIVDEEARANVERRLSGSVRERPFYRPLVDMEIRRREAEDVRDDKDAVARHVRAALNDCRLAAEATFRHLGIAHPLGDLGRKVLDRGRPHEDRQHVEQIYESAARAIGIGSLPRRLLGVRAGDVDDAARGAGWKLGAVAIAHLLRASESPDHPLRAAARSCSDIFERIARVAHAAGENVHDGDERQRRLYPPTLETLEGRIEDVFRFIESLMTAMNPGQGSSVQEVARG